MKTVCGRQDPLIFAEWLPVGDGMLQRRDYSLTDLLAYQPMEEGTLFSYQGEQDLNPKPVREFLSVHFFQLGQDGQYQS